MTNDELDAIEARANAATLGPWRTRIIESRDEYDDEEKRHEVIQVENGAHFAIARVVSWYHRDANVSFLATARQDVPALIAEVRRLRARMRPSDLAEEEAFAKDDRARIKGSTPPSDPRT